MELDDWQKEVLAYEGDFILCTGRQIGKTTVMAIKAAEFMKKNPKKQIIIISLTEDQAKLIIVMILAHLEKICRSDICKGNKKPTQNKIQLKNGSTALARPVGNTGDAIRGFTGDILIIDEGSRMPEMAFTSGEPTLLSTGGQIWMASTPHGKVGYFWEQYNNAATNNNDDYRWKVFHKSSEEVIMNRPVSSSWNEEKREKAIKRLNKLKATWSELRYGQEILGLFMDDLMRFFDDDLIKKCCILKRTDHGEASVYMGSDLARLGGDEIAHEMVADSGEFPIRQVESLVYKKQLTPVTERQIVELTKTWKARKVGIDAEAGALGVSILDHLRETEIRNKVIPLNNRKIIVEEKGDSPTYQRIFKEDLYDNLKSMMEHGEALLLDDEAVIISLKSVQMEYIMKEDTPTGVRIFSNPHSQSHVVEALTRAFWIAKKEKTLNLYAI